ncbi:MAG: hypothetical protein WB676_00330 [Bryobacteraceae bacterium]
MISAESLFEAAHRALQNWALLYWFDPTSVITVAVDCREWEVRQEKVRVWSKASAS